MNEMSLTLMDDPELIYRWFQMINFYVISILLFFQILILKNGRKHWWSDLMIYDHQLSILSNFEDFQVDSIIKLLTIELGI